MAQRFSCVHVFFWIDDQQLRDEGHAGKPQDAYAGIAGGPHGRRTQQAPAQGAALAAARLWTQHVVKYHCDGGRKMTAQVVRFLELILEAVGHTAVTARH